MLEGLNVETGRVVVMAKDHSVVGKSVDTVWQKEPWYGTEYTVETMDTEFMEAAKQPNDIPELFLPGPNEFIPTNVEVEKIDVSQVCQPRPSTHSLVIKFQIYNTAFEAADSPQTFAFNGDVA